MVQPALSIACGPRRGSCEASHLKHFQESVKAHQDAIALISAHQKSSDVPWTGSVEKGAAMLKWSYRDLDSAARRLAIALANYMQHERAPIAAMIRNQAEWALLFLTASYLRCAFVPMSPDIVTRSSEFNHMLDCVTPSVLVACDQETISKLEKVVEAQKVAAIACKIALDGGPERRSHPGWIPLGRLAAVPPTSAQPLDPLLPGDTVLILFTSGTTSLPKACAISSRQCLNAALGCMDAHEVNSSDIFIQTLPGFHSYGIGWSLGVWCSGGTVVFPSPGFAPEAALRCISRFKATRLAMVPTTAQVMLQHSTFSKTDCSSLQSLDVSGAGVHAAFLKSCAQSFPSAAVCVSYGMTECPGTLALGTDIGSALQDNYVWSGKPVRNAIVKICVPRSNKILQRGHAGELHVGGPQAIRGYFRGRSANNDHTFYMDPDGVNWVVSGDQAIMSDDGMVRICGRYKDMIIRGGENISPATIEKYLNEQDGIQEAFVVGVPDDLAGEVPVAVVTTCDGAARDLNFLKRQALNDLGIASAPKLILDLRRDLRLLSFPETLSGKVRKAQLKEVVRGYLAQRKTIPSDTCQSTIDVVVGIWQEISGITSLQPGTVMTSFADSLMLMQFSSAVKQKFDKDITVEDLQRCATIQAQCELIDLREVPNSSMTIADEQRQGPPDIKDVSFLCGDAQKFEKVRTTVTHSLVRLGLDWSDVEDIYPLPDWPAIFCHRCRPSSWTLRFSYHAKFSVDRLEQALVASLQVHPTLRAISVPYGPEIMLVTVRPTVNSLRTFIARERARVKTARDLTRYSAYDFQLEEATEPGLLVRFHFVIVEESATAGLIVNVSHAIADMTMTKLWLDDLAALLIGEVTTVRPHCAYKRYATAYWDHRDGAEAIRAVDYWTQKLLHVGSLPRTTFWPRQRSVEWFKGNDKGWKHWNGDQARQGERSTPLELKLQAQKGIRTQVPTGDVWRLKAEHDVPIFMVVKAALAALNVALTGAKEAVFGTINAARTWPFRSEYTQAERSMYDSNPLDITGCTTEYVLDRIRVDPDMPVLAFLRQVTEEEALNSSYAHAPFRRIVASLRDPISTKDDRSLEMREQDAAAVLPLIRRQSFNWLPRAPHASDQEDLQLQEMLSRMDNGLTVTGFLDNKKTSVSLGFTWDAEHLTYEEAGDALALLARMVGAMCRKESWKLTMRDVMTR